VKITFDGRSIKARDGDTVASALYRNGVRIYTRRFKYHRPRGLLCNGGRRPNLPRGGGAGSPPGFKVQPPPGTALQRGPLSELSRQRERGAEHPRVYD